MPTRIFQTPHSDTLLLAECALLAYDENTIPKPPAGYKFVKEWKGIDPLSEDKKGVVENYGIIFQNTSDPTTYIFAFRGTAGKYDILEDLKFLEMVPFQYYKNTPGPKAPAAKGFSQVYTTKISATEGSMQEQLFQFLEQNTVNKLYITGHSLGSALSELFNLDLNNYIAQGHLSKIPLVHINFACPRVGGEEFAKAYVNLDKSNSFKTIRVVNWQDFIPCEPKISLVGGYYHGPDYYLTYFDLDNHKLPDIEARHSIYNYLHVLTKQFGGSPSGTLTGYQNKKIYYWTPSKGYKECQIGFFHKLLDSVRRFFRRLIGK